MEPIVAGVDEVGRGALAGPVVAAAVIFPYPLPSSLATCLPEIKDSKLLSRKQRTKLAYLIMDTCDWSVSEVPAEMIDKMNIFNASLYAMAMAVEGLHSQPGLVLVDGKAEIPNFRFPQRAIIDGDQLDKRISAASIVAKNYRDTVMIEIAPSYPEYGFEKHVGYGTKVHKLAIAEFGPSDLHRKTFRGVSEYVRR